jgi:hypothetical protein
MMSVSERDRAAEMAQTLIEAGWPEKTDLLAFLSAGWPGATLGEMERGLRITLELISCRIGELRATPCASFAAFADQTGRA